jgi:hypothetical protein
MYVAIATLMNPFGLLLGFLLPGFFVSPDETDVEKIKH